MTDAALWRRHGPTGSSGTKRSAAATRMNATSPARMPPTVSSACHVTSPSRPVSMALSIQLAPARNSAVTSVIAGIDFNEPSNSFDTMAATAKKPPTMSTRCHHDRSDHHTWAGRPYRARTPMAMVTTTITATSATLERIPWPVAPGRNLASQLRSCRPTSGPRPRTINGSAHQKPGYSTRSTVPSADVNSPRSSQPAATAMTYTTPSTRTMLKRMPSSPQKALLMKRRVERPGSGVGGGHRKRAWSAT